MKELTLPVRHEWRVRERAYGKIAIEPFEPGFALTVGNAYRRVLLSAIAGAAPTWVKIEGVLHEFSYLPGVTEDTLDIIMRLRKLPFTLHVDRPKVLRLKVQGAQTVTARDFEPDPDVEILAPDAILATLEKDGSLEMEVCVEQGRGYQPAEKRAPEALAIDAMLIDADFSPVKQVNFHVERFATPSAWQERLILEVWTNGSVTPETAAPRASSPITSPC
jgi:DNA-directed RNA polymerase subunit alpha